MQPQAVMYMYLQQILTFFVGLKSEDSALASPALLSGCVLFLFPPCVTLLLSCHALFSSIIIIMAIIMNIYSTSVYACDDHWVFNAHVQ